MVKVLVAPNNDTVTRPVGKKKCCDDNEYWAAAVFRVGRLLPWQSLGAQAFWAAEYGWVV